MTHEHLSDEQLSAHLDGEMGDGAPAAVPGQAATQAAVHDAAVSDSEVGDEIAGCPTCRERLVALSRAQALVRLPVDPVLPSIRAAAVASALAEASESESVSVSPPTDLSYRAIGERRSPHIWTGAAAAAAILLVVVGVSLGLSHSRSAPSASSASAPATTSPSASSTHSARLRAPTPFGVAKKGGVTDLGSLPSVTALKAGVARALGSEKSADQSVSGSGAKATGKPSNSATAAPSSSALTTVPSMFSSCVMAAQSDAGGTGLLELVATATYARTPALVVVVDVTQSSSTAPGPVAVVVARSGCRVLARTTF